MSEDENFDKAEENGVKAKKKITIQNRRKFDLAKVRGQKRSHGVVRRKAAATGRKPNTPIRLRKGASMTRGAPRGASSASGPPKFFSKRYKVISEIGRGGSAAIYKAKDTFLGTDVAIKLLPRGILADHGTQERFKNEARIAMQLAHENIARLFHFDADRGRMYLVMEYVPGEDFRKIIEHSAPLDLDVVLDITHSLSLALDYAHRYSVFHRDLKPENIMLSDRGRLKVIDFGTARGLNLKKLETEGEYIEGTPTYAAPEQFQDNPPSAASDIYSMGAVIQELLTGAPIYPFDITPEQVLEQDIDPMPEFIPHSVQEVISRALSDNPDDRWQTAEEFCTRLYQAVAETSVGGV